jgi:hypothetical protein
MKGGVLQIVGNIFVIVLSVIGVVIVLVAIFVALKSKCSPSP